MNKEMLESNKRLAAVLMTELHCYSLVFITQVVMGSYRTYIHNQERIYEVIRQIHCLFMTAFDEGKTYEFEQFYTRLNLVFDSAIMIANEHDIFHDGHFTVDYFLETIMPVLIINESTQMHQYRRMLQLTNESKATKLSFREPVWN